MPIDIVLFLMVAFIAANLPFLLPRVAFFIAVKKKHFGWCLAEWLVWLLLIRALSLVLESQKMAVHSQDWPFYITGIALFAVFAFPGFVYRYFWRLTKSPNKTLDLAKKS